MGRITDYKIVGSTSFDGLEQMVNEEIKDGWQPIGGISLSDGPEGIYQAQAMVVIESDIEIRGEVVPPPAMPQGLEDDIRRMGTPRKRGRR